MTFTLAWLVSPLLLGVLSFGCGLLAARVAGLDVPAPLVLPLGFAVVSLAPQFALLSGVTAELAAPLVVVLAVAGLGLAWPWRRPAVDGWLVTAGTATFAVFAAPIVLSGRATFAGYIKLDDTATYLAMLDRALEHGYNVAGLAPSTYEATLATSLAYGYPLGSVLPLGVGHELLGVDSAWLWQPYLTFLAALVACCLYHLVSGIVASRPLRALVAFVGAQAALVYGYALWGGVKELSVAVLAALIAALVPIAVGTRRSVALALACAALLGTLSVGGAVWLAPPLAAALALALRRGRRDAVLTSVAFLAAVAVLAIPSLAVAGRWLGHSGAFTSSGELANLIHALNPLQALGIWPNGDFRTTPPRPGITYALLALAAAAAVVALVAAVRRRTWELPIALATAVFACAVYVLAGSPWIAGKALASASPIVLATALAGAAAAFERGPRVAAALAGGALVLGVLWSNALQYHDVDLAPSGRLSELATIGHRYAGQGPTLMTEFESYGTRHFLRALDPEAASELRRRYVYLRGGGVADPSVSPDVDEIALSSLLPYRTLVLRRSGVGSRPPSIYAPVWTGRFYQVWQRPSGASPILSHLSLGSRYQPAARPDCGEILRLARLAQAQDGLLAAVERPPAIVLEADGTPGPPRSLGAYGEDASARYLSAPYEASAVFAAPRAARYGVWVGGSFKGELEMSVDGRRVGGARDRLGWPGTFVPLGAARLGRGRHILVLRYAGPDLHPGSGGTPPFGLGPIALSSATNDSPVAYVRPADARLLCGRSLDWVEALRG